LARYRESVCRLCRREGLKLFLKGDRCYSEKCAFERRGFAPGDHGLLEKQFRGYFGRADRQKGITGTNLLLFLERRLDNMVFRMGFANSRTEARQLVRHNHFLVGEKKVNIPSYLVKPGDEIRVREGSRKVERIIEAMETVARRGVPQWLEVDKTNFMGVVKMLPAREELTMPVKEQLVVELYSK
jgi:small subunit ribosomal protein S4